MAITKHCVALVLATVLPLILSGCGDAPSPSPPAPPGPPAPPTPTPLPQATNLWQWRSDMQMGPQTTYDLSDNIQESGLYGACWKTPGVQTLAGGQYVQYGPVDKQFVEDGNTYGTYDGETGVSLFNKRNDSTKPGCLMRKSRLPIDLSKIGKIEMDVITSSTKNVAPWYAIWLAPMMYADTDDSAKAAEIDMIENYDGDHQGDDVNNVNSNFATCGDPSTPYEYTKPYCKQSSWGAVATSIKHHISVIAKEDPTDGRVIRVYRCPNTPGSNLSTCPTSSDYSEIKVTKPAPPGTEGKWFKIWDKDIVKKHYGHYWLVTDMWWTSGTDFKLSVDNIKFFEDDGTEWKMPLQGAPPTDWGYEGNHDGGVLV